LNFWVSHALGVYVFVKISHHLQHTGMECDTGMQAQAWLRWEMGLSFFSTSPFVVSWDGHQYLTIPSPLVWKIFLSL
jgi:hypothetical protein